MSIKNYFIKHGYVSRDEPEYCVRDANSLQWQLPMYKFVRAIADEQSLGYVVDIGCGHAEKLIGLFHDRNIIGIDVGHNIEYCARTYPKYCWLTQDFNKEVGVVPVGRSLIVCADVIEHLVDPMPLLWELVRLQREGHVIALSTPERDIVRGVDDMGPPANESHVREWNMWEFSSLCGHIGFAGCFGLLKARSGDVIPSDMVMVSNEA